jgi:hypothetical protein
MALIKVLGSTEAGLSHALVAYEESPTVYRFITKRFPDFRFEDYFFPREYLAVYEKEIGKLKSFISTHPKDTFEIGKLGGFASSASHVFEEVIQPRIKTDLKEFTNVRFTW